MLELVQIFDNELRQRKDLVHQKGWKCSAGKVLHNSGKDLWDCVILARQCKEGNASADPLLLQR